MKVFIALSALIAVSLAASVHVTKSPALIQFEHMIARQVVALFATADTNHNGRFDKGDMSTIFRDYDLNHDHNVTEHEFVTAFAGRNTALSLMGKGLFLELDMNKDHTITDADLTLFFDKLDQNDDGRVDKHEFEQYFKQLFTVLYLIQIQHQAATTTSMPMTT